LLLCPWNFVARHDVEYDHSSISSTVLVWFRASEGYERQLVSPKIVLMCMDSAS
jgi:hypothetical protein